MSDIKTQQRAIRQGTFSAALRNDDGTLNGFIPLVTAKTGSTIAWTEQTVSHMESESGLNQKVVTVSTSIDGKITVSIESNVNDAIALGLRGSVVNTAGATVVAEAIADTDTVTAGRFYPLTHFNVTNTPVIKDSAGSPATLVAGTDYIWHANLGMIEVLTDLSGYTLPLTAGYTYGASDAVGLMTELDDYHAVRFSTLNRANNDALEHVILHKVRFSPMDNYTVKSDGIIQFNLTGDILIDETQAADATLGQYGKIIKV